MDQTNQPTSQENPDELVILEEGPGNTTARSQVRSYECNFCKRGFSNAQALGGHMNIHRKDKAKLKRRRSSTLEIPNSTAPLSDSPLLTNRKKQSLIFEASDSSTRTNKYWPWKRETRSGSLSRGWDDADVWEFQLMPNLFVDRLSSNQDHHHHQKPSDQVHGRSIDSGFSSSSHGLPSLELDLELRLGSEPLRGSVSPSRSTIKFF